MAIKIAMEANYTNRKSTKILVADIIVLIIKPLTRISRTVIKTRYLKNSKVKLYAENSNNFKTSENREHTYYHKFATIDVPPLRIHNEESVVTSNVQN